MTADDKKIAMYILIAVSGIGIYFFFFHHNQQKISFNDAAVRQQAKADTALEGNQNSVKEKYPDTINTQPVRTDALERKDKANHPAVKRETENEQRFRIVGQFNDDELLQKLKDMLWNTASAAEKDQIAAELTERLRKTDNPALLESISELLAYNTLTDDEEIYLINFLGKLGTLDAIQALAALIPALNDGTAKEQLAQVFLQMGYSNWRDDLFAKNPHPLEQAWRNADGDEMIESAVAKAIAGIGTENGINLLFKSLDGEVDFSSGKNLLVADALAAANKPEAIQILGETLRKNPVSNPTAYASGYALAHSSNEQAVVSLLDWASNAAEEDSQIAEAWLRTALENNEQAAAVFSREAAEKKFDNPAVADIVNSLLYQFGR
ncbi:hypothetical protein [Candidatus Electronema sp. JC]|uniref:hypothetical protein n=1 Tax=Candidatus Electronema sp. JC TaxID=3401570 RepID=UPI003B43A988